MSFVVSTSGSSNVKSLRDKRWYCGQEGSDNKDEAAPEGWPVVGAFGASVCARLTDDKAIIQGATRTYSSNKTRTQRVNAYPIRRSPEVLKVLETISVEGTNAGN